MKKNQIYHTAQSLLAGVVFGLTLASCESLDQGNLSEPYRKQSSSERCRCQGTC